jgi:hypothetical protein
MSEIEDRGPAVIGKGHLYQITGIPPDNICRFAYIIQCDDGRWCIGGNFVTDVKINLIEFIYDGLGSIVRPA